MYWCSLFCTKRKPSTMTGVEWGGIVRIYSSGTKTTWKAWKGPLETTKSSPSSNLSLSLSLSLSLTSFLLFLSPFTISSSFGITLNFSLNLFMLRCLLLKTSLICLNSVCFVFLTRFPNHVSMNPSKKFQKLKHKRFNNLTFQV